MRYVVQKQVRTRTVNEITKLLNEAKLNLSEGVTSGKYVEPCKTDHINWRAGENYNRMTSYIADLTRELSLPYESK